MNRVKSIWIYTIFIFLMSLVIVLSWDDLSWGGSIGLNRWNSHFAGYNGRYVGNLIVMAITRYKIARVTIYSVVNVGIAIFMSKLIGNKVEMRYIVLILLTLPIGIFRQTFGWLSGFANYNVSTFLVLVIFYFVFKAKYHWTQNILILFLGFGVQFFAENVTIVNLIISFSAILYNFLIVKSNKKVLLSFSWLISSIAGYIVMFQNTAYHSSDGRGLSNIYISELYKHALQDWSELVVKENIFLILLFSIVIYFVLNKPKMIGGYLLYFNVYFIVRDYLNITYEQLPLYVLLCELVGIILFFIILVYVGIVSLKGRARELYIIFLLSAVLMVGPFVIVTPFGPRNILLSYIMLAISLGILFGELKVNMSNTRLMDAFTKKIIFCLAIIILGLYSVNCVENIKRINIVHIADAKNEKSVEIRKLPFPFLGQQPDNIKSKRRLEEFKEYYDISPDIEVKIINRKMPLPWIQTNE